MSLCCRHGARRDCARNDRSDLVMTCHIALPAFAPRADRIVVDVAMTCNDASNERQKQMSDVPRAAEYAA